MMKLKYLLLIFLSQMSFLSFSQTGKKQLNEFLILGTLNDYLGRTLDPRRAHLLDRYDSYDSVMKSITDSLIKTTYPKTVYQETEIESNSISSTFLANRFNTFYNYGKSGSSTLDGRDILVGTLKDNILQHEQEKMAFLAGAFLRFGSMSDTAYCIIIANSMSKAKLCNDLLKEFGCKPYYNIRVNYIPVGHDVFFHPSPKVLAYFKQYEKLFQRVENSRKSAIQRMINKGGNQSKSKK
jgi:hypothetical protein